jgi:hypothetical protein
MAPYIQTRNGVFVGIIHPKQDEDIISGNEYSCASESYAHKIHDISERRLIRELEFFSQSPFSRGIRLLLPFNASVD